MNQSQQIQDLGFIPPSSIELEKAVIGAILIESNAFSRIESVLADSDFYQERHAAIFHTVRKIYDDRQPVDALTVIHSLRQSNKLEEVGGPVYLSELMSGVASSAHLERHAAIIKQKAVERDVIKISHQAIKKVYDGEVIEDVMFWQGKEIEKQQESLIGKNDTEHISDSVKKALNDLSIRMEYARSGKHTGIDTGLKDLDKVTGGWQNSDLVIIAARPAMGKALRMDANILTPTGWKLNRDLKVGDEICSIDGCKSYVKGIFPQGFLKTYMVEFSDGRMVECCGSHLWSVESCRFHKNAKRIVSTLELIELLKTDRYKNRISIPNFNGDFGVKNDFLVHPYLLGVLLGDGCLTKGVRWSKPDIFIADRIRSFGYTVNELKGNSFSVYGGKCKNIYLEEMRKLNLIGKKSYDKFIPKIYLSATKSDRIELLKGLLDTDGSVDKLGSIEYSTSSKQLAKDVQYLAWSLGYKCSMIERKVTLYGVEKRNNFRLVITSGNLKECFSLPRKLDRIKSKKSKPLVIRNINQTGKFVECQCISVTHESELYVTDNFIMTHNTAFALHFAKAAALGGSSVAMFSLEMSDVSLANRLLLSECGVDANKFRSGKITKEEEIEIEKAAGVLCRLPIYVDDNASVSMSYIRSKSRLLNKQGKCSMVVIDYLQLASASQNKNRNREQEIAQMSREAKIIAKELNIPVLLLSQLSRKVEERTDKRPLLSDLRESGAIEQDADMVCFIHRPEYYGKDLEVNNMIVPNGIEFIISKYRNGATGSVIVQHDGALNKIFNRGERDVLPF